MRWPLTTCPPDICHPGQTEVAATRIFQVFFLQNVVIHMYVGKANTWQFSGPEQPFKCLDDKQLRMFCLDSLPTKGNDLSWWYTCPQAILPIAPNCVYLASGLWCLVSVIIWLGLLFRATSLHNDLINKANGTSVLTMVAQWLKRVKIIFHFAFCSSCSCSTLRLVPGKFVLITSFARLVSCNSGILEKQPFKKCHFFRIFCK